jgi:hypothetical protein
MTSISNIKNSLKSSGFYLKLFMVMEIIRLLFPSEEMKIFFSSLFHSFGINLILGVFVVATILVMINIRIIGVVISGIIVINYTTLMAGVYAIVLRVYTELLEADRERYKIVLIYYVLFLIVSVVYTTATFLSLRQSWNSIPVRCDNEKRKDG